LKCKLVEMRAAGGLARYASLVRWYTLITL